MRVVALEEHFVAPALALPPMGDSLPAPLAEIFSRLSEVGDGRIADMDAHGIDFQVLGHNMPGTQALTGQEAVDVSREINDFVAETVRRYPDRLGGFAVLPTSEPDDAAKELVRAKQELGLLGTMINGTTGGRFLDDPYFLPMLEAAERLEMPIYLHPAIPLPAVLQAYYDGFPAMALSLSPTIWGWHNEVAVHVLRMILGGVFDRLPGLQIIIGHMGEGLPFMLGRIDDAAKVTPPGLERPMIADYFRHNIHITTAGTFDFPALLCSMMVVGADRIMFSVDYPYCSNEAGTAFLAAATISSTDKELIAHRNADILLGLT